MPHTAQLQTPTRADAAVQPVQLSLKGWVYLTVSPGYRHGLRLMCAAAWGTPEYMLVAPTDKHSHRHAAVLRPRS